MGKQTSTNKHSFNKIPRADIQRSSFDRSHGYKCTFDSGYLIPIFCDEALPGDTFNLNATLFARLSTPIKPVMDNMHLETFWFAIPNRLVWDNWKRFNGEQDNPGDSTDFLVPQFNAGIVQANDLSDYMGIPPGVDCSITGVNQLHHRAYNMVWNDWFRDQNLQDSLDVPKDDLGLDITTFSLQKRGKRHDYFTSGLPWPQKGQTVTIPLGDQAPVTGIGALNQNWNVTPSASYETGGTSAETYSTRKMIDPASPDQQILIEEDPNNPGFPGIYADLSQATASTINALREAFQIQRLYEKDARSGTRYIEVIQSHFGVTSPDSRQQRSEFLNSSTTPVNITIVPSTVPTDLETSTSHDPQGNLAGYGTATGTNHGFTKSFTEHCVVIGLACVRADLNYQQGLNRMWSRQTRFDFYWPVLSHLGEQEILNKELYVQNTLEDDQIFAYQERYAEYRYKPSTISSQFRSSFAQTLDVWHLAQNFENLPVLNSEFIEENPPIDRIVAVPTEPQFIMDSWMKFKCARPMPTYAVPGMIDHF